MVCPGFGAKVGHSSSSLARCRLRDLGHSNRQETLFLMEGRSRPTRDGMLNLGGGTKRGRPSSMESGGLSRKKNRKENGMLGPGCMLGWPG